MHMSMFDNKKTICVFAHPDDEAFGPAGTIAKLTRDGEVQIICITDGNSPGTEIKNLAQVRKEELRESARILGISKIYFLKESDGCLCNENYHKVADKVEKILTEEKPDALITFESGGFTGHLDHIATSMITTFVFERLKFIKKLYYYCGSDLFRKLIPSYFVYFPKGYSKSEVDHCIDVSETWEAKINAIKSHVSQEEDINRFISLSVSLPKEEYFVEFKN